MSSLPPSPPPTLHLVNLSILSDCTSVDGDASSLIDDIGNLFGQGSGSKVDKVVTTVGNTGVAACWDATQVHTKPSLVILL